MTHHLTTSRGDTVAYDLYGSGPPLIFIAGAGSFRKIEPIITTTAQRVAQRGFTTIDYDSPGRGESTATPPIHLDRAVAALAALIDAVGGPVTLCGHSSGAAIALYAAASGLPVNGLALWEVPIFGTAREVQVFAQEFSALLDAGDHHGALEYFCRDIPPEIMEDFRQSAMWEVLVGNAQTQRVDAEALAWFHSAPLAELMADVNIPMLTMVGESTFDVMHQGADAISQLPDAKKLVVPGARHNWEVEPMVETLVEFVSTIQA